MRILGNVVGYEVKHSNSCMLLHSNSCALFVPVIENVSIIMMNKFRTVE